MQIGKTLLEGEGRGYGHITSKYEGVGVENEDVLEWRAGELEKFIGAILLYNFQIQRAYLV